MKVVIALFALVVIAVAGPVNPDADAYIIKQTHDHEGPDKYQSWAETSNGINLRELIERVNIGSEDESIKTHGFYEYVGSDGVKIHVKYEADENGFRPTLTRLPK